MYGSYDVRVVGDNTESMVVSLPEAKRMAKEQGLDLIEINGKVRPNIVRIASYDKFLYEYKKKLKKNKQQAKQIKEIQLKVNIGINDLKTKANHAREFIEDGYRVKVVLIMKGRELARREENKKTILQFIVMLEDVAVPESQPRDEGNRTVVMLKKKP